MKELVLLKNDEAFTNSLIIADGAGIEHRALIQLISSHIDDVSEFGRVTFEMLPFETNGGTQKVKMCNLNEEQATFVISLMKNTRAVIAFKKELVKQFFQMRKFILEKHSSEWIKTRYHSKISRKAETDIIKQLVNYAEKQGSKNADKLYIIYSKLANKTAGISSRDNATINQLNNLSLIENILLNCIRNGMTEGKGYKEIYQVCKARLELFSDIAYLATA